MGVDNDIPGVEVFGRGRGTFTLPAGFVDAEGQLHDSVCVREMTGVEEDILDDDMLTASERMSRVLSLCIESIGDVRDEKLIGRIVRGRTSQDEGLPITCTDRLALMFFLRIVTLGKVYHLTEEQRKCPFCDQMLPTMHIDLGAIEIPKVENPSRRRVRVKLPRSGKTAILRVLNGSDEEAVSRLTTSTKDIRSLALVARVDSLDDEKIDNSKASLSKIKALPKLDRQRIFKVYNRIEGSIDTSIEMTCKNPACAKDFTSEIDMGQLFTVPQEEDSEELEWL